MLLEGSLDLWLRAPGSALTRVEGTSMRATRLMAAHDIRTADVRIPDPGPGGVLLRIEAAGICGTDRHLFRGEFPCTPPVTLGHEFSGIVVGSGAGVDIPEGTRVVCDPNDWCGRCDA